MNWQIEKSISENIRRIRSGKNITQDALAAQMQLRGCDITRSAVAKIEAGQRHIYLDEIILIREILGVSLEDLFHTISI